MSKRFEVGNTCGIYDLESNDHEFSLNDIEVCDLLNNQTEQISALKEKLAEKDNTITNLIEDSKASKELLKTQLAEKDNEINVYKKYIKEEDLYKISFCIEQLEKVKELVEEKSMTQSPFGTQKIYANDVSVIIDNQIKEIKRGEVV